MTVRLAMIAAATLAIGTGAAAEPPKAPVKPAAQQPSRPAQVMLASVDQIPTPAPADQQTPAPVKKRAARVTSCRCGDQVAEEPGQ